MLTEKQERFVQELIKGASQREAYRIAYPKSKKWKDSLVDSHASDLLKNGKVMGRYNELRTKANQAAEDDAVSIRAMLIKHEKAIACANIMDFYHFDEIDGVTTLVANSSVSKEAMSCVSKVTFDKIGRPIYEFYDKQKAHEHLAEWFGITEAGTDRSITVHIADVEDYTV